LKNKGFGKNTNIFYKNSEQRTEKIQKKTVFVRTKKFKADNVSG